MKKFLPYSILIFLLVCFSRVWGQGFSVQNNIQLLPPYSVYLSDYVSPESGKITVSVQMNDMNPTYSVRLKFTIKGDGITIESKQNITPAPLFITGGSMEFLSASDLAYYFDPANLNFYGITREQYIKSGRLPEGIYQFCVQTVEYNTGTPLSNVACATAWLILNDPPRWILPEQNARVLYQDAQNVLFTWLPLHTGSPNSAFSTEYEFTMVEVWPSSRNANDAINTSVPIFKTTTENTSLIYGPAETPLVVGRRYACRIRAYDKDGRDLFKNKGYSEVLTFIYGEECKPPYNLLIKAENYQRARVSWTASPGNSEYRVRYRVKGDASNPWYEIATTFNYATIDQLKSGSYEIGIMATCSDMRGEFSASDTFSIPAKPVNNFDCGKAGIPVPEKNELRTTLSVGETIRIGGFDLKVMQVSNVNGTFTGKGMVIIPFMNYAKVGATFVAVKVNDKNEAAEGNAYIEYANITPLPPELVDRIAEVLDQIDQKFYVVENYLQHNDSIMEKVNALLDKAKDISEGAKALFDQGKALIAQGKDKSANGDEEGGRNLMQQGWNAIKEGLASLGGGGNGRGIGLILSGISDNLDSLYFQIKEALENISRKNYDTLRTKGKVLVETEAELNEIIERLNDRSLGFDIGGEGTADNYIGDPIEHNLEISNELKQAIIQESETKKMFEMYDRKINLEGMINFLLKHEDIITLLLTDGNLEKFVQEMKDKILKNADKDLLKLMQGDKEEFKVYIFKLINETTRELAMKKNE